MKQESTLPPGFEDLCGLLQEWCLPDEPTRYAKRLATPLPQLRQFYDRIYPRMDDVLRHLEKVPLARGENAELADRNLFYLALAYFEASHPVELCWKSSDLDVAFPSERIAYVGPSSIAD
jgi:hypothetical protein